MDIAIVLLIIAIAIIAIAIVWLLWVKLPEHDTMIYERRLKAEAEYDARLMGASRMHTFGGQGFLTKGVDKNGMILYEVITRIDNEPTSQPIDAKAELARADAIQLVNDSIVINGGASKQLLTCDVWQDDHGHRRDDWEVAKTWLCSNGYAYTQKGGTDPGTFVKTADLNAAMLALAVHGRPPRSKLVEAVSVSGNGNMGI